MTLSFCKKSLLSGFVFLVFSANVNASVKPITQCAQISVEQSNQYRLRLEKINGDLLFSGMKSFSSWREASSYKIPPGSYEIVASISSSGDKEFKEKPIYFALQLKNGHLANLKIKESKGVPSEIVVEQNLLDNCIDEPGLHVEQYLSRDASVTPLPISKKEQSVLQNIFAQIITDANATSNTLIGLMPAGMRSNLGVRFDKSPESDSKGLQILSVTPLLTGHKLGLLSGDRINAINQQVLQGTFEEKMDTFFSELGRSEAEPITIEMTRNEQRVRIKGQIEPSFVPRYNFSINASDDSNRVYTYTPISESARYQLDRQISQLLARYHLIQNKAGNVSISIPAAANSVLGISGIREEKGIRVNFVAMESIANRLGLSVGDLLISVNGKTLTNSAMLDIEQGKQEVTAVVYRNEKQLTLNEEIEINQLPEIELTINTQQHKAYLAQQQTEIKVIEKLVRRMGYVPENYVRHKHNYMNRDLNRYNSYRDPDGYANDTSYRKK